MLKLGINEVSNEFYHSDREYISSSGLKKMLRDPEAFYKTYVEGEHEEQEYNPAFAFGSYMHSLILEPHLVKQEYAIFDGPVRRGKRWEEFKAANADKTLITQSMMQQSRYMFNSYENNPQAVSLIEGGTPELTLCHELDGIKVKVRCDSKNGNKISDVKTTFYGVSKDEVINTCIKYDYDLSAALYADCFAAYYNEPMEFYFIFINKREPTNCEVYKASEQFIENGRRKYKEAIRLLKQARETGVYYDGEKIKEISMPESCLFRV